jgi:hypothetical protein
MNVRSCGMERLPSKTAIVRFGSITDISLTVPTTTFLDPQQVRGLSLGMKLVRSRAMLDQRHRIAPFTLTAGILLTVVARMHGHRRFLRGLLQAASSSARSELRR